MTGYFKFGEVMRTCNTCFNQASTFGECQFCRQTEALEKIASETYDHNSLIRDRQNQERSAAMALERTIAKLSEPVYTPNQAQTDQSASIDRMIRNGDVIENPEVEAVVKRWINIKQRYIEVTQDRYTTSVRDIRNTVSKETGISFVEAEDVEDYLEEFKIQAQGSEAAQEVDDDQEWLRREREKALEQLKWAIPLAIVFFGGLYILGK